MVLLLLCRGVVALLCCVVTLVASSGKETSFQRDGGQQEEASLPRKYTQEAAEATQEAALPPGAVPAGLVTCAVNMG